MAAHDSDSFRNGSNGPLPGSLGEEIVQKLELLSALTDEEGAITRLYLSAAHRKAVALVMEWMGEAGMSVRLDSVGNVVGRYEATGDEAPALLLGSHIDTVKNAGKFDGCTPLRD